MERNTSEGERIGPGVVEKFGERVLEVSRGAATKVNGVKSRHVEEQLLDDVGAQIFVNVLLREELLKVRGQLQAFQQSLSGQILSAGSLARSREDGGGVEVAKV